MGANEYLPLNVQIQYLAKLRPDITNSMYIICIDGIRSQLSVSMDLRKSLQQLHSCDYSNDIKQLLEELSQVLKIKDIV